MTILQIIFLLTAFLTLLAALRVVTSPSMVHAALWLILALAGVAVVFILLNATFLAVVQVAVYIDAIAIMIIIVVMLTRGAVRGQGHTVSKTWWAAALSALVMLTGLLVMLLQAPVRGALPPTLPLDQEAFLERLGQALVDVNQYILPFEVASVLLVAAMVGAIIVAWPLFVRRGEEER